MSDEAKRIKRKYFAIKHIAAPSLVGMCAFVLASHVVNAEEVGATSEAVVAMNVVPAESENVGEASEGSGSVEASADPTADDVTAESAEKQDNTSEAVSIEQPAAPEEMPVAEEGKEAVVAAPVKQVTSEPEKVVHLSSSTVYMSERQTITDNIATTVGAANDFTWTLDDKPLEEWKTWVLKEGKFNGDPFITVADQPNQVVFNFNPLFGEDLSLRSPSNIRRIYRDYMKTYVLKGVSADGKTSVTKEIHLRPYADFMTHEELQAHIDATQQQAAPNRYVTIESIGTSAQQRDIRMGIIAENSQTIQTYLNDTVPKMLTQPDELLALLKQGNLDYKVPILINNTHADEQPGIDIIAGLFRDFATKDQIQYRTVDEAGQAQQVTLTVSDVLKKVILLFNFTENPDGNVLNLRQLANGMDPNRDAGYQTNPETRATVAQINKWHPLALYDIHGFVKDFLIEPATPPHDPNFEYDLLSDALLKNAQAMGRAGITNSKYTGYIIPKLDYGSGWDDSFSGYTGVYQLYHGGLGHTLEIPEMNQASYDAGFYAVLAGINFVYERPDQLFQNRLMFYSRGIHKVEAPEAETELVGPDGKQVGRIKGNQPKFFPDYYVIPMGVSKDRDMEQAYQMIEYFKRNGVIVKELTQDLGEYHKGDLVIDMAQPKRGYANHVLYKGSDESAWPEMYAEVIMNFPTMRGFKAVPIFQNGLFNEHLGEVTHQRAPRSRVAPAPYYRVSNSSLSAIQAVNDILAHNGQVYLTEDGYIFSAEAFNQAIDKYALFAEPLYMKPIGPSLRTMKVYSPDINEGWIGKLLPSEASNSLRQMGFQMVNTIEEADVVVLDNDNFTADIFGKKPVLIIGGNAMAKLEKLKLLPGFDAEHLKGGSSYEGLLRILVDAQNKLSSGYALQDLMYSNSGSWIEALPEGFKSLASIMGEDYYLAGWWPNHDQLGGKMMVADGEFMGQPMFIYAGNPMNKLHSLYFYRWVSNAILRGEYATLEALPQEESVPQVQPKQQPLVEKPVSTAGVKTLPAAGEEAVPFALIGSIVLLFGGTVLYFKRKAE